MKIINFTTTNICGGYVPYSGQCPKCGSKDLWDDNLNFGCNDCSWFCCGG